MKIGNMEFLIKDPNLNARVQVEELSNIGGIKEFLFSFNYDEAIKVQPISITFYVPALNILTAYSQMMGVRKVAKAFYPEWEPYISSSRLSSGCPTLSLIDYEENNAYTISVSEIKDPVEIKVGVVEEDANCKIDVVLFPEEPRILKNYEIRIRVDERKIPYGQALVEAEKYLFATNEIVPCYIPEATKLPVYSTWYSWHQNLKAEELIQECIQAKKMGMETIIVDDGWQTNDNNRGYGFCGDWELEPTKFSDIKDFVEKVHAIGMKVMFWFSLPFLGKHAKCYDEFKSMILDEHPTCCVLDPRYPKVRNYLIEKYIRAIRDWGLDGLKLDFINLFKMMEYTTPKHEDMDYENLYDALNCMMTSIKEKLQEINPEIMLEFRQMYIGPLMQTYGNIFRVSDCPCDALTNRVSAIDMRLNMPSIVVHSDMIMWNYQDCVESAAKQLLSIFFTVPQISVRLKDVPNSHKQMLEHYLSVWLSNKDVLLDGTFVASGVEGAYTYAEMENDEKYFVVDFGKNTFSVKDKKCIYLNVTANRKTFFNFGEKVHSCCVFDALGNEVEEIERVSGLRIIEIPNSGMVVINN